MNCNDNSMHSPNFGSGLSRNVINKQYLTPCRQVGLRRKSGSAKLDETSDSKRRCVTPSVSDTPKCTSRLLLRKKLMSPAESTPTRNLESETSLKSEKSTSDAATRIKLFENTPQMNSCPDNGFSSDIPIDPELLSNKSKAVAVLEDIKKRMEAKEKLKNSLQQRLLKMKKGNEHLSHLERLRATWKEACQAALKDLLYKTNLQGHSLNMKQLMEKLGISNELLPYNSDEEEFDDVDS